MDIEIGVRDTTGFATERKRAHFYRLHETYGKETDDGREAYEINADLITKYLQAHKDDPEALETCVCILANAGVSVNLTALKMGEQDHHILYETLATHSIARDVKGASFLEFKPLHMARMMAHHHRRVDKPKNAEDAAAGARQLGILTEFLKELGLEPNPARIKADFCTDCNR